MLFLLLTTFLALFHLFICPPPHTSVSEDKKEEKLNVLLMIPCFHFNRSHVNFALSLYMVIRKEHNIRLVVPFSHGEDIAFLKKIEESDSKFARDVEFFDLGASEQMIGMKQKDGTVVQKSFAAGIRERSFGKRMAFFPYVWIDYLERKHQQNQEKKKSFDVGIAEFSQPNQHAFAVFKALGIEDTIVTRAMSPALLQYEDLGLLKELSASNIPTIERPELANVEDKAEKEKQYKEATKGAKDGMARLDKLFRHLPNLKEFNLRDEFGKSSYFFVNSRPELEYDGGALLALPEKFTKNHGSQTPHQSDDETPVAKELLLHADKESSSSKPHVMLVAGLGVGTDDEQKKKKSTAEEEIVTKVGTAHDKNESTADTEKMEIEAKIASLKSNHGHFGGIVLISFGSVRNTASGQDMNAVQFDAIRSVTKAHPNKLFIWQLTEGDTRIAGLNNKLPNVYSKGWVNQKAILAHPDIVGFVSHCGKNSQFEAALFGVFVVCVPMFLDQFYNAESSAHQQLGSVLNYYCVEVHGKQYAVRFTKHNGNMELDEDEGIDHDEDTAVVHTKFWDKYGQRTVTVKGRDGGPDREENVLTPMKEPSRICFTSANITAKLKEAMAKITAKGHSVLATVKERLQQSPAENLVLEALGEILEKKKNKKKEAAYEDTAGPSSPTKRQKQ